MAKQHRTTAYTIPQRRASSAHKGSEPRGLSDLDYGNFKLILLHQADGAFSCHTTACPFPCTPVSEAEVQNFDEHLKQLISNSESDLVSHIHLPKQLELEEGAGEVFKWFLSIASPGGGGTAEVDSQTQLCLPSTLSPEERKRWHQAARNAGLYSASSGLRENRRLVVRTSAIDACEQWKKRDMQVQGLARESHELLCEAHGGHSEYSLSELEEMIVRGVELPPVIETMKCIKKASSNLWGSLDQGDAETAVQLLRETEFPRELACRRNPERTSYPIHAAVSGSMPAVALELANPSRYAGVFMQRDSSGRTALGLACSMRQVDLVVAFMKAGAVDVGNDIDALHRNLIRAGDHNSRRVLNACAYTSAFRRKKQESTVGVQDPEGNASKVDPTRDKSPSRRRIISNHGVSTLKALLNHEQKSTNNNPQQARATEAPNKNRRGRGRFHAPVLHSGMADHTRPKPQEMESYTREQSAIGQQAILNSSSPESDSVKSDFSHQSCSTKAEHQSLNALSGPAASSCEQMDSLVQAQGELNIQGSEPLHRPEVVIVNNVQPASTAQGHPVQQYTAVGQQQLSNYAIPSTSQPSGHPNVWHTYVTPAMMGQSQVPASQKQPLYMLLTGTDGGQYLVPVKLSS